VTAKPWRGRFALSLLVRLKSREEAELRGAVKALVRAIRNVAKLK